jgi:hypothetical protein
MVKVRISQIPEESGKPIITKKCKDNGFSENTETNSRNYNDDTDGYPNHQYVKSMISFPEGVNISLYSIETIEKDFRVKESNYGGEKVIIEYGIVINKDMEPSMRYPRVDVEIWFESEEVRDQRYDNMLTKLKQSGFKFIDV